jgi:leucyl-tRNA synthetase
MMPHLAEELWQQLGHDTLLAGSAWPQADPALTRENTVTVAIQVSGKLRATLELQRDLDRPSLERAALANDNVQKAIDGRNVRKIVVVPNRIVNVVV